MGDKRWLGARMDQERWVEQGWIMGDVTEKKLSKI